ncbi:thiaminase II [Tautonia plasticadhaerens]|uniref:Aminopyrimidine aminohydrolase n=1 Tax=Tautonia plasticadhaerens TaxID=2527974 RepID=A0A518H6V5_9BACT|nr:thiaminase II [Tautonia plasticadhaerens]QDV36619.1 Thiaminase-2 [Tautonia plasticadhaerens]
MADSNAPFTDALWEAIGPIYGAILGHPFVSGLTDGRLTRDRFAYYVVQDALYLGSFARALSALAASAPDGEATAMFNRHAGDAIAVERSLHDGFLGDLGLHPEQVDSATPSPTTQAYCDFLLASSLGRPFHQGLAAVLPCYWIYQRVGRELLPKGSPDPIYRRWIDTYGGDRYDEVVREVLALTDRVAVELTGPQRDAMQDRFVLAGRYEWMFWDAAYRLERWPV